VPATLSSKAAFLMASRTPVQRQTRVVLVNHRSRRSVRQWDSNLQHQKHNGHLHRDQLAKEQEQEQEQDG
jgi:hypothetical protein